MKGVGRLEVSDEEIEEIIHIKHRHTKFPFRSPFRAQSPSKYKKPDHPVQTVQSESSSSSLASIALRWRAMMLFITCSSTSWFANGDHARYDQDFTQIDLVVERTIVTLTLR